MMIDPEGSLYLWPMPPACNIIFEGLGQGHFRHFGQLGNKQSKGLSRGIPIGLRLMSWQAHSIKSWAVACWHSQDLCHTKPIVLRPLPWQRPWKGVSVPLSLLPLVSLLRGGLYGLNWFPGRFRRDQSKGYKSCMGGFPDKVGEWRMTVHETPYRLDLGCAVGHWIPNSHWSA